jgi:hypothetical protein
VGVAGVIGAWLGPLLFIAAGVAVVRFAWPALSEARESRRWPVVPGRIVASAMVTRSVTTGEGTDEVRSARITYAYEVAGRRHQAHRVFAGRLGPLFAGGVLRRHRKGQRCRVAHHPLRPQVAVLEPGVHAVHLVLPGLGVVLLALGLALAWFARASM